MDSVEVIIVKPNGEQFKAEVDPNVEDERLIADIIEALGLDGEKKHYTINLIGGTRIKKGVTIQLLEIEPSSVKILGKRKPH